MKKVFILSLLLANGLFAFAQVYVKGIQLTAANTGNYFEVDPSFLTNGRCIFQADYGQSEPKEDYLTDSNGKRVDFRSLVDGLNFLYDNGWEVAQITVQQERGRRFLLKRR
jgi:hypothetical protein